ncbi:MAG: HPr(Ser) kinase/phosphatase [Bacilli bacterium]|nr:HPr(Ser) kinase/phosphatase [Bacilli bacterium]
MKKITIQKLVNQFNLEVLAGQNGLARIVEIDDIHRPGLEFTGFFDYYPHDRIQILGRQEVTYLHSLTHEERDQRIGDLVKIGPPCFIITRGQEELTYFEKHCTANSIPLLRTAKKTTNFISELNNYLEKELAKEIGVHGVCLNVFGIGILLRGESGIGKSEAALELIEKGHRLISDDLVILKQLGFYSLIGTHNGNNRDFLALRGIGLIDIPKLYGSGSFQEETKIDLDILLAHWEEKHRFDSLDAKSKTVKYIDVDVPHIEIPIRPGRNIAAMIEVAAKNWRLHKQGYDALKTFEDRIAQELLGGKE